MNTGKANFKTTRDTHFLLLLVHFALIARLLLGFSAPFLIVIILLLVEALSFTHGTGAAIFLHGQTYSQEKQQQNVTLASLMMNFLHLLYLTHVSI